MDLRRRRGRCVVSPTHTYQSSGYFLVSLTLKDATGNSATATLSLVVDASAMEAIKANPDPTDVGVPVVFQAEIKSGPGGLTYDWTFGDGYASSTASPVHTYQATGSYLVNVTATAPGGGQINASILIGVAPDLTTPVVTANPLTPELGQLVNLTARELAGAPPYSYSWAFGDGGVGGNMSAISHIFTTSGPFSTVVTVTDRTGQRISGSLNLSIALNLTILGNWSAGAAPLEIGFASQARGAPPRMGTLGVSGMAGPARWNLLSIHSLRRGVCRSGPCIGRERSYRRVAMVSPRRTWRGGPGYTADCIPTTASTR